MTSHSKSEMATSEPVKKERLGSQVLLAVGLMAAGSALAPLLDAAGKTLVATYPVFQIVWMRYAGHAAFTAAVASRNAEGRKALRPSLAQILRGSAQFGSSLCFIAALRTLSLTTALVIVFLAPLLVIMVRACLGFRNSDRESVMLAALGVFGVFISYAPNGFSIDPVGVLEAALAAVLLATYFLLTGHVAGASSNVANSFHTAFPGAILGLPLAMMSYSPLLNLDWVIVTGLGLGSAISHLLIAAAMRSSFSSAITPIAYVEVPAGALYAALIFGDHPSSPEVVGGVIVVATGIGVAFRLGHRSSVETAQKPS